MLNNEQMQSSTKSTSPECLINQQMAEVQVKQKVKVNPQQDGAINQDSSATGLEHPKQLSKHLWQPPAPKLVVKAGIWTDQDHVKKAIEKHG